MHNSKNRFTFDISITSKKNYLYKKKIMNYKNNKNYKAEEVKVSSYDGNRYKKVEENIPVVKIKDSKPTPKAIQKDIKVDRNLYANELNEKYSKELKAIENSYLKHFPNGDIKAYFKTSIGDPSLYIRSVLIKDKKDQSSGIFDNDPFRMNFIGFIRTDGTIELENTQGSIYINPPKNSFLAMTSVKVLKRKQTTTLDKHVINIAKHYKKAAKVFNENKDNLYKKDIDKKYLKVII